MYINYTKRTILALILCLAMFLICFTMHISATTDSDPGTESGATESDPVSSDISTDVASSEPVSSEEPVTSSEEESNPASSDSEAVSSEAVSSDESLPVSSLPESSLPVSSADTSSAATSSLSVETVSEGGAPDDTYVSEYHADGSYVYEGSYAGLSSSVSSKEDEKQTASVNRTPDAQRYARYAKIGMVVFGLLSIGLIAALIYFNVKVAQSKKLHPEWYPKKEKNQSSKPKKSNRSKPKH